MTANRDASELLGQAKLFRGVARPVLEAIAAAMQETAFGAGQLIFSRGDPGTALHLVREGRVRLSILTVDGRELSFSHAVPGDVFGEIAVLDGSSRSANATALGSVKLLTLSAAACERLIEQHPTLARSIIRFLCTRLREVSDHLEDIALLPIEARLARYLLDRLKREASDRGAQVLLELGISQGELALLLGATRPKVNAALMMLEDQGALRRNGSRFECDVGVLNEIARRD